MNDENEVEIHLNANGVPNVDFYVERAKELRNEAIIAGFRAFKNRLFGKFDRSPAAQNDGTEPRRPATQSGWPWVDLILQGTPDRTRHA